MSGERSATIAGKVLLACAAGCFLFGAGVTVIDVVVRAVAGRNVPAAIELTSLSIGLGALLSMPSCYARRVHVTARLLSEIRPYRFARPLGLLGALASVGFAALLFFILADNTLTKLGSPETTSDLGLSIPLALTVVTIALGAALVAAIAGVWFAIRRKGEI